MWDLYTQPANIYFSVALTIMLMLGILELINLMVGGLSDWMDQLLPESLLEHSASDVQLYLASSSIFLQFLAWLYLGKVPVLMWLIVFLASYSITGLMLQQLWFSFTGDYLLAGLAGILVFFVILPVVRYIAMLVYKVMPKDFTTAIHSDSLVGSLAEVILGDARQGYPAQAKLKDQYGQTHYILVEPDQQQTLLQGSAILLVARQGTVFKAILKDSI